jgi:two-component system cell cycle sensor histidine kinase/response regulator CckA
MPTSATPQNVPALPAVIEPDVTRLSALVDAGPEAISIVDGDWRYVYVNLAFERMSQTSDEIIGKSMWEAFPQLIGSAHEAELRELMRHRKPTELEYRVGGKTFDIRAMPFGDGVAFFTRDVTELRRANEEMRRNEERFRAILNHAPGCVMLMARDCRVLDVNPAGIALLEIDEIPDLIGRSIIPFVGEADQDRVRQLTARVFEGGSDTITFEVEGCRGARLLVEHRAVPLRDADGAIVAALSTTIDITQRQAVEDKLRRRALQHAILASLGALALRDTDVDELTQKTVDAVSESLGLPKGTALDLLRRNGLADASVLRASGEHSSGPVHLEPEDADFVRSAANLLMSDIERRRAEDALRERDEQLRQAQKMEAIGQLAGGVAHDFNNLLTIVNVHSDLLLATMGADNEQRADVEEIARAAARAASLTKQLLTFSRKQVIQPRLIDLSRVATGMEPMLRRLIGEDVDFDVDIERGVSAVLADESDIEQVLLNLVVNARDAMPQGGRLRVRVGNVTVDEALCARHPSLRTGDYIQLTVQDSGMGMTSETIARAFEPFFTTKEPGRGTGLGLATVYGIVKMSGGTITIDSDPGAGSTFCVYLPRVTGEAPVTPAVKEQRVAAGAGETILLVEDEEPVRRLAQRVLESQGYRVLVAINGDDALRLATDHAGVIDLLLSDVVMPGLGGRVLAERLTVLRPGLEILFMSGYTDDDILRRGLLERGQRLLQKPFSAPALAHEVRTVLDAQLRRRNAARGANPT